MRKARKKSLKRHRKTVNKLDSRQKYWQRIYRAESDNKNERQLRTWAIRKLARLTAILIAEKQRRA